MNDHEKSQHRAQRDEYEQELSELLQLLAEVDLRITPEHVAKRFRDLLDEIGDDGYPAPPVPADPAVAECDLKQTGHPAPINTSAEWGALVSADWLGQFDRHFEVTIEPSRKGVTPEGACVALAGASSSRETNLFLRAAMSAAAKAEARRCVEDARRGAEQMQDAALEKAARIEAAAREKAARTEADARQKAECLLDEARQAAAQIKAAARAEAEEIRAAANGGAGSRLHSQLPMPWSNISDLDTATTAIPGSRTPEACLSEGWQLMSGTDYDTECSYALLIRKALASDQSWACRRWNQDAVAEYGESVCVVADRLRVTWNDHLRPVPVVSKSQVRTVSAWGGTAQSSLARLRVLVVGAGSVGLDVAMRLAATGITHVGVMDFDSVEFVNLDRMIGATTADVRLARGKRLVTRRVSQPPTPSLTSPCNMWASWRNEISDFNCRRAASTPLERNSTRAELASYFNTYRQTLRSGEKEIQQVYVTLHARADPGMLAGQFADSIVTTENGQEVLVQAKCTFLRGVATNAASPSAPIRVLRLLVPSECITCANGLVFDGTRRLDVALWQQVLASMWCVPLPDNADLAASGNWSSSQERTRPFVSAWRAIRKPSLCRCGASHGDASAKSEPGAQDWLSEYDSAQPFVGCVRCYVGSSAPPRVAPPEVASGVRAPNVGEAHLVLPFLDYVPDVPGDLQEPIGQRRDDPDPLDGNTDHCGCQSVPG